MELSFYLQELSFVSFFPPIDLMLQVSDLLATLQKGWIDEKKFTELLQGILF